MWHRLGARDDGARFDATVVFVECPSLPQIRQGIVMTALRVGGENAIDPPLGNIVMWRGLSRLTNIELGAEITAGIVGN